MKILVLIFIGLILYLIYKKTKKVETFFEELTNAFPQYTILKKIDAYLICNCKNTRGEPEELAFIRFNPKRRKMKFKRDNHLVLVYPKKPSIREVKNDLKTIRINL